MMMVLTACSDNNPNKKVDNNIPTCKPFQVISDNKCIDVGTINSIKPLVVKNEKTTFTIMGKDLSDELVVELDKCTSTNLISQSDSMIKYECIPKLGTHGLAIKWRNEVVYSQKISVKENTGKGTIELPSPPKNPNSTLKGVDENANGVRDEVEIELASYITDVESYQQALVSAKAYQQILEKPSPVDRTKALSMMSDVSCQLSNGLFLNKNDNLYLKLTFDNAERQDKYSKFVEALDGGFDSSELANCQ